jgi:hypothetical protein
MTGIFVRGTVGCMTGKTGMRGGGVVGGGVVIGGGVITRGGCGVLVGTVMGTEETAWEYAVGAHSAAIADATISDLRKKPDDFFMPKPL